MTNFCFFDAVVLVVFVVSMILAVEAAIRVKRIVGYAYLFFSILLPILLYMGVYYTSAEVNIMSGSTWARLHLFLRNYCGNAWMFWAIIFAYNLLVFGGVLLIRMYNLRKVKHSKKVADKN